MKSIGSFLISGFLASALLAGCGGGGSDSSSPSSSAGGTYGSLTFSGSGTAEAGTSFAARTFIGGNQWYNIDLRAGTTYPYIVVIVFQDSAGNVSMVDINKMTSQNTASGEWSQTSFSAGEVTATASGITFNNLVVPGYGASPSTSLTLNGTLRLQAN